MNCLILYSSRYGQTEKIARRLGELLESHRNHVDLRSLDENLPSPPTDPYDLIVVGSPLYVARYSRQAGRFIQANRRDLQDKVTGFFSVSLAAHGDSSERQKAEDCMDRFLAETGWQPTLRESFAGGLPYQKYNWLVRWMMKRIVRKAGGDIDTSRNYEYTDWDRVNAFSEQLLEIHQQQSVAESAKRELTVERTLER